MEPAMARTGLNPPSDPAAQPLRFREISPLRRLAAALILILFATAAAAAADIRTAPARSPGADLAVVPEGPGWLALPALEVRVDGNREGMRLWAQAGPGAEWVEIPLADGAGGFPFPARTVSDLWGVRFRVEGAPGAKVSLRPTRELALSPLTGAQETPGLALFSLANWGPLSRITARAADAAGADLALETARASDPCTATADGYDLGFVDGAGEAAFGVRIPEGASYPVTVTAASETGQTASFLIAPPRPTAGAADQIVAYGIAKRNFGCGTTPPANATQMVIIGVTDGTTYTVTDLNTAAAVAAGTVNRGQKITLNAAGGLFVDNHKFKLASSRPVQAYMGYDCSGTLPGTMFFLSDGGGTEYGRSFTVPFGNFSDGRVTYWVFAAGAGTVQIKTLAGAVLYSNTFTAAGAWRIPFSTSPCTYCNTVLAAASADVDFALEQSSQNAATEVPPTGLSAAPGSCTAGAVGRDFFVHVQPWGGNPPRISVFPYASGRYTVTRLRDNNNVINNRAVTLGTLDIRDLSNSAEAYRITSTADIGVLAGSNEGGTAVYDTGDDSFYHRGAGNQVRGHAMRCGGTVFAGQDGTVLTGACTPGTPCGLPGGLPVTLNADGFVDIAGNTANNNLFNFTTQDAQHIILVEVVGGNCDTALNDWSKIMRPTALARPVVTYPGAGAALNSLTPTVTGTGVPGSTITLRVYDHTASDALVFTGTTTVDAAGNWSLQVTTPLTEGHQYYFEPVQGLSGVCPVNPLPPPGSSGASGTVDTTPPTVTINQATGQADPTNASPILFTVVFSEAVADFATGDVVLSGTAGATAAVVTGSGTTYTVSVSGMTGSGTVIASLLAGIAHDAAGNASAASASTDDTVTYDVTAPAAALTATPVINLANQAAYSVSGTCTGGDGPVSVLIGTVAATGTCTGGTFTTAPVDVSALPDGPVAVSASQTDAAGNTGSASGSATKDTAAPAAPAVTPLATTSSTPTITGTWGGVPGESLTVLVNGVAYTSGDGNLSVSGTGWTLAIPPGNALPDGTYDVAATATDPAGNSTTDATTGELVVTLPRLLRNGDVTQLSPQSPPNGAIFVRQFPLTPALDTVRDLEQVNFASGASFPHEATDLAPSASPLVFYEMQNVGGATLRVTISAGKVVVTY